MGYAIAGLYVILTALFVPILTTLLKLNREVGILAKEIENLSHKVDGLAERLDKLEAKFTP